jgi:hypothetical protein
MLLPFVAPALPAFPSVESPRCGCWGPGYVPSQVTRMIHSGPIGGDQEKIVTNEFALLAQPTDYVHG